MSKEIYYLAGTAGCGKSETFNRAFQKFIELYLEPESKFELDFLAVLTVTHKDGKKKVQQRVGISTAGDAPEDIKRHLQYLVEQKCEVILTATHDTGKTITEVKKHEPTYKAYRISKEIPATPRTQADCTRANQNDAEKLVEIVRSALGI